MVMDDKKQSRRTYPAFPEGYKLLECVGRGSEGSVWRALCIPIKKDVAIKIIDLESLPITALEELREQVQMMYSCSMHPHVVRYYTSFVNGQSLWCVMKYLSGGSCSDIMRVAHPKGLDEAAIKIILKDTLKAIEYLHANGRIHRDIKAGNIVISESGCVQLADFGVSGNMAEQLRTTLCGSPCWMAPEVMLRAFPEGDNSKGYDASVDIWSLGITALELARGRPPFSDLAPSRVFNMIVKNPPPILEESKTDKKKYSSQFKDFISTCLQKDPAMRPSASKLLKHKFFRGKKSRDYLVSNVLSQLPPVGERHTIMEFPEVPEIVEPTGALEGSWNFPPTITTTDSGFEPVYSNSVESTNFLSTSGGTSLGVGSNLDSGSSYSDSSFFDDLFAAPTPSNTMTNMDFMDEIEELGMNLENMEILENMEQVMGDDLEESDTDDKTPDNE